jgi:SAM-dependent methyltransferase
VSRWNQRDDVARGGDYDARWERLREQGESVHGEADLIEDLLREGAATKGSGSVLDAGCGTGRVGIELDRRGIEIAGVDLDPGMLDTARAKAPHVDWHLGDLFTLDLDRQFDLVAAPGNVMIFVEPLTEAGVIARLADHPS